MAQAEQTQHEHIISLAKLKLIIVSLIGVFAGYAIFYAVYGVQGEPGQIPPPFLAAYQVIKDLYEILFTVASGLLTVIFELLLASKNLEKFRKIIKKIQAAAILVCLVFCVIVGYSIAEKGLDSKQLASHPDESPSILTPDEVDALELFCWINIKILPSNIPDEQIIGYRVIGSWSTDASLAECALNPLSAINHMIIRTKLIQYELILEPERAPSEPEQKPEGYKNVVVRIKEVLVEKNGEPLIGLDSLDPQFISYGASPAEWKTEKLLPSPEGYVISCPAAGTCYIKWDDEPKRVGDDNTVDFEDRIMETNGAFSLTADNLKELLGDKLPQFPDTSLKAAITEIGTSQEAQPMSLPLEMSTREGRILYHWRSGQDDFYFSINSLATGHKYIEKEASDTSSYRLLCELSIK